MDNEWKEGRVVKSECIHSKSRGECFVTIDVADGIDVNVDVSIISFDQDKSKLLNHTRPLSNISFY